MFITDGGTINDGAYNQSAWNGVRDFADSSDMSCRYYQPSLDKNKQLDNNTVENYIKLAVNEEAKYIIMQGEKMSTFVEKFAPQYDADNLDYDYSFNIQPVYKKISECEKNV